VIKTGTASLLFSAFLACTLALGTDANAAPAPCASVEIAPPPPTLGTNAAALRSAAEVEVQKVDAALQRGRRRIVISLALSPEPVGALQAVGVNATVRDARTGAMLAVIETNARASGPASNEQRRLLAFAAVRNAVRQVPGALRVQ
jgi:hypothetical protein